MRFASLGSGSRGNGLLVESADTCLLLDCGFSEREARRRLAELGRTPEQLSAILVTHEHSDHIGGVGALARKHGLPVWMTHGTCAAQRTGELPEVHFINSHEPFALDALEISPVPVPHDAREPVQFVFSDGARRLGVLTDIGSTTPHVSRSLDACDALVLECNHDEQLLARGPYPERLKQRVGGPQGHLSNRQSAELLARLDASRLQHLLAAHLSEKNNTPGHAVEALSTAIDCTPDWITVMRQDSVLQWREISP